jgi:hypothetical protein
MFQQHSVYPHHNLLWPSSNLQNNFSLEKSVTYAPKIPPFAQLIRETRDTSVASRVRAADLYSLIGGAHAAFSFITKELGSRYWPRGTRPIPDGISFRKTPFLRQLTIRLHRA